MYYYPGHPPPYITNYHGTPLGALLKQKSPQLRSPKFGVRLRRVYPIGMSPRRKYSPVKMISNGVLRSVGFGAHQRFQMQLRKLGPNLKKARNAGNKNAERKILAFINRLILRKQGLIKQANNIQKIKSSFHY